MTTLFRYLTRSGLVFGGSFYAPHDYLRPRRGDAANDFSKIMGDMRNVGADARKAAAAELKKHDKQAH